MAEAKRTGRDVEYEKPSTPSTPPIPPKKKAKPTVEQIKTVTYATLHAEYFDAKVNQLLADGWKFMTEIIVSSDSMRITAVLTKDVEV